MSDAPPSSSSAMAVIRKRPHRKVRSGCYRCKSKKIKCDERKPQCSHCERYSAECNYPSPPTVEKSVSPIPVSTASPSATSGASPLTNITSPMTNGSSPKPHGVQPNIDGLSLEDDDLNTRDLELMHHWSVSAHDGFGDLPGDERMWQVDITQLAMQHPFLMHGLLSLSALHLALMRPKRKERYLFVSAHHQNLALPFYRNAMMDIRNNLNEENCHPLLAFASLTVAYSIAYPKALEPGMSPTPEWFYMLRGPRNVVSQGPTDLWSVCAVAGPWLMKGPMAFQLRQTSGPIDTSFNPDDMHLTALEPLFERRSEIAPSDQSEDYEIYRTTLSQLREFSAIPYMPHGNLGPKMAAFQFVEKVSERFIDLLSERRPEALIIMAHLCVLLKQADQFWFMQGAAQRHLATVMENLDEPWRQWIQWPVQQVMGRA